MTMTTLMMVVVTSMVAIPLTESILTMGMTLMVAAISGTLIVTSGLGSWFGFILFLMYITGMLVLFSYMMAMTPNNQYTKSATAKVAMTVSVAIWSLFLMKGAKMTPFNQTGEGNMEDQIIQLYTGLSMNMYWTMAVTLLTALLMAVKLCYKSPKPLRQFLK